MVLGPLPAALLTAGGRNGAWDGTESDGSSADRARRDRGHARVVLHRRDGVRGRTGLRFERLDLRSQHVHEPDPDCRRLGGRASRSRTSSGQQRFALLFEPGTYGSSTNPAQLPGRLLHGRGGPWTLAGRRRHQWLGLRPQPVRRRGSCTALNNFWRSLSNLTINVTTPNFGCYSGEFWPVSQAAPMRRVHVNGFATLMDYCTQPSFASGGFIADFGVRRQHHRQRLAAAVAGQEQRSRRLDQRRLEPGLLGRPGRTRPVLPGAPRAAARTRRLRPARSRARRRTSTWTRGELNVFVPAAQTDSVGHDMASGPTPGASIPIGDFFVAGRRRRRDDQQSTRQREEPDPHSRESTTSTRRSRSNARTRSSSVSAWRPSCRGRRRPDDGRGREGVRDLGEPSSTPARELARAAPGRQAATPQSDPPDPTVLSDVFFRIGGATPGRRRPASS